MIVQAAICVGGALDGKTVAILTPHDTTDYTLHRIELGAEPVIYMYVSNDLTATAALHTVFAAYAKKGKK